MCRNELIWCFDNGYSTPFFRLRRDLILGCHLDPLLLLVVVEGLGRIIHHPRHNGSFKRIHIEEHVYISHLFCVDDNIIFSNGDMREINLLMQGFLDLFSVATGMVLNVTKSSISLVNINKEESDRIYSYLNYPLVDVEDGLFYLGFVLKSNAYLKRDWVWPLEKIEKGCILWCNKWLSRGGHLILVKIVLESIPVYCASLAYVASGILDHLRKLYFSFI